MSTAPVTVTVTCRAKPGMEQRTKEYFIGLLGPSRAEDGCIDYYWQQSLTDPAVFLLYMNWRDEAAFDRHVHDPLVSTFDQQLAGELLAEPYVLTRWQQLG